MNMMREYIMTFTEEFSKNCSKYFKKVYILHGSYQSWDRFDDDDDDLLISGFNKITGQSPSWVDWLIYNKYVYPVGIRETRETREFTQKFIDEVVCDDTI